MTKSDVIAMLVKSTKESMWFSRGTKPRTAIAVVLNMGYLPYS